ncbi:hypothetical protein JKY79_00345 [Candidatus Babeliales bacterium]|nr:hypothetical protein [Candidatus Babeliales bacterium]
MKKKSVFEIVHYLIFILVMIFSGCVRNGHYKLARLTSSIVTEEKIVVKGKTLTSDELQGLLGGTCNTKEITVIQLYLNNTTPHSYIFAPRTMNTKAIPLNVIARSFHKNILARLIPLGLVSVFCWPFCIPTTILGMRAMHYNEMVDRQLYDMGIDTFDSFIIEPYSTLNRIMFIKNKHFPELLSLQLEHINSSAVSNFSIDLTGDHSKVV